MSGCGHCPRPPWPLEGTPAALMEEPSCSDEQCADDQKADVPGGRSAEVVPDMVDLEYVVIDQAFDDIEYAPAHEDQPEVEAPAGRRASSAGSIPVIHVNRGLRGAVVPARPGLGTMAGSL